MRNGSHLARRTFELFVVVRQLYESLFVSCATVLQKLLIGTARDERNAADLALKLEAAFIDVGLSNGDMNKIPWQKIWIAISLVNPISWSRFRLVRQAFVGEHFRLRQYAERRVSQASTEK